MNSLVETVTPVVDDGGFTIVEEDDVAFSLSLCREIHRIYGSYLSGELDTGDSVRIGLLLTTQMFSMLAGSVTKGMPAMRIEVAAAQAREMVSVLFGEPITTRKARAARPLVHKHCQRSIAASAPVGSTKAIACGQEESIGDGGQTRGDGGEAASLPQIAPQSLPTSGAPQSASKPVEVRFGDRCRDWFQTMPTFVQMLLGIVGCGLAAALLDLPVVILLLFSNLFLPLSLCFVAIAVLAPQARRLRRSRRGGRMQASTI